MHLIQPNKIAPYSSGPAVCLDLGPEGQLAAKGEGSVRIPKDQSSLIYVFVISSRK